jgi:prevent-host-death family protein
MFHNVNSRTLRTNFRAYLDHVMATGERVLINRHGREVAALVCREDFEALEEVTNRNADLMEHRHRDRMERLGIMKAKMR